MAPQIPLSGTIGLPGSAALLGFKKIIMPDADYTPPIQDVACQVLELIGNVSALRTLTLPANDGQTYIIFNFTSGDILLNGGGVRITQGSSSLVTYIADNGDYANTAGILGNPATVSDGQGNFISLWARQAGSGNYIWSSDGVLLINTATPTTGVTVPAGTLKGIGAGGWSYYGYVGFFSPISGVMNATSGLIFTSGGAITDITIGGASPGALAFYDNLAPILTIQNSSGVGGHPLQINTGGTVAGFANSATIPDPGMATCVWSPAASRWFVTSLPNISDFALLDAANTFTTGPQDIHHSLLVGTGNTGNLKVYGSDGNAVDITHTQIRIGTSKTGSSAFQQWVNAAAAVDTRVWSIYFSSDNAHFNFSADADAGSNFVWMQVTRSAPGAVSLVHILPPVQLDSTITAAGFINSNPSTITDVTASRSLGVEFQNTSGRTMEVSGFAGNPSTSAYDVTCLKGMTSGGLISCFMTDTTGLPIAVDVELAFSMVVPPGAFYQVNSSTLALSKWVETLY